MKIKINGREYTFDTSNTITIAYILEYLKLQSIKVVVEKNGLVIDNINYNDEQVSNGDVLEIVQFVGGG